MLRDIREGVVDATEVDCLRQVRAQGRELSLGGSVGLEEVAVDEFELLLPQILSFDDGLEGVQKLGLLSSDAREVPQHRLGQSEVEIRKRRTGPLHIDPPYPPPLLGGQIHLGVAGLLSGRILCHAGQASHRRFYVLSSSR